MIAIRGHVIWVFIGALAAHVTAHAQHAPDAATARPLDPSVEAEARSHFDAARRAHETGDWPLAVREFEEAHRLSGYAALLYNIYSAAERGGMWERAADALDRYLREGDPGDSRGDLELRLARLRARIAERDVGGAPSGVGATFLHPVALGLCVGGGIVLVGFGVLAVLATLEDQALANDCGVHAGATCAPSRTAALEGLTIAADVSLAVGATTAVVGAVLLWVMPAEPTQGAALSLEVLPWVSAASSGVVVRGVF